MTEQEFITRESLKNDARIVKMLTKIERTGFAGKEAIETALVNGWIEFGPPSESNRFNHYRLTAHGQFVRFYAQERINAG